MKTAADTKEGSSGAGCSSKTAGGRGAPPTEQVASSCRKLAAGSKESAEVPPARSAAADSSASPLDDAASTELVNKNLGDSTTTPKACTTSLLSLDWLRPVQSHCTVRFGLVRCGTFYGFILRIF